MLTQGNEIIKLVIENWFFSAELQSKMDKNIRIFQRVDNHNKYGGLV